jgi:hypothetical protein
MHLERVEEGEMFITDATPAPPKSMSSVTERLQKITHSSAFNFVLKKTTWPESASVGEVNANF